MKIGIDLDNVLNNLNEEWLKLYNIKHNDNLTINDIKSWYLHKYTKIGTDVYNYLTSALFYKLKPQPYSVEVTERLSQNHELFIVTATAPQHLETKAYWLQEYFPHISVNNLIATQRKDLVNVDLLIDDAAHNIETFPNNTIVLDYAWNKVLENKYLRAKNWLEIEEIIVKKFDNN